MRKVITEELKQEIREYYLSYPMTLKQVEDKYNLSHPTITKILKDIPKHKRAKVNSPNLKEDYFHGIDSEEKAYFIGLLISDGNVFKDGTKQASISITLDLNDEYILQKFKEVTGTNTNVGHDGRGCGQIAIRSDIMANDLETYGIVPRKSYITYLPTNIEDKWMPHLIRGILDGDGHIIAHQNGTRFLHGISFCGSHKLMEDLSNYSNQQLKLKVQPKVYDYKDRQLSEIKFQNIDDIYTFGEWIYKDETIYLTRKKDIYEQFKTHYNLK